MEESFLGKGWSFPPEFRKGIEPTVVVTEEKDIRQSLEILMRTNPGERVHRYDFGCGIRRFIHEDMTLTVQTQMQDVISRAVLMFEPRVTLNEVNLNLEQVYEGVIWVELDYTVRRTNSRTNMVFPFYLREGTDIGEF